MGRLEGVLCLNLFFFFTLLLGKLWRLLNAHPAVDVSRCSAVSLAPSAASNYRLYQSDISPRTSVGRGVEPYRTADSVVAPTSEGEEARWEGAETRRPATFLPPPTTLHAPSFLARRAAALGALFCTLFPVLVWAAG